MARFTTRRILLGFGALAVATFALIVYAGNLEPPGPPGSTMRTLQEIYDLLVGIADSQAAAETPEVVGAEPRLIGCMRIDDSGTVLESGDPNDAADPICGTANYTPPRARVLGSTFLLERPAGAGGLSFEPYRITKNVDRLTPLMMVALRDNTSLTEVAIDLYRDNGGAPLHYLTMKMTAVRVGDVKLSGLVAGSDFIHVEETILYPQVLTVIDEQSGAEIPITLFIN